MIDEQTSKPPLAFQLHGDVAIVTGAGSRMPGEIGNGRATAILLARQGAKVALLDVNTEWVEETKRMIAAEGGISEVVECDVTNEESCKAAVARTVALFGAVHILVNIVGVDGPHGTVVDVDLEVWDRDFRTNVTSMVLMSRYVIPEMRKVGRGSIVNMASVSGCGYRNLLPSPSHWLHKWTFSLVLPLLACHVTSLSRSPSLSPVLLPSFLPFLFASHHLCHSLPILFPHL